MPGARNGSSFYDAFEWDHSQYPGGIRVFWRIGQNSPFNLEDWWEVRLLSGVTYTIQTRAVSTIDSHLELYDDSETYQTGDDNSGDDGSPYSKMSFTPGTMGMYYIRVRDLNFGDGGYILECTPAPALYYVGAMARAGSRLRAVDDFVMAAGAARFAAQVDLVLTEAVAGSRFGAVVIEPPGGATASRFRSVPQRRHQVAGRFDAFGVVEAIASSRFDARARQLGQALSRFGVRGRQVGLVGARHSSLVRPGWALWARDVATGAETMLGWIDAAASPAELADIPLSDGTYEIEVRPAGFYWEGCRGRQVVTMRVVGGSATVGLPAIQELSSQVVAGATVISWKVAEELGGVFDFGVWYSASSPVDTSGDPDVVVAHYAGVGAYQVTRSQAGEEYVAVATRAGGDKGEVAELHLPWSAEVPPAPADQFAYRPGPEL